MNIKQLLIKVKRSGLVKWVLKLAFQLASKLPIRKKTIVFESFLGKQYSDNPKALYLYIKENYPDYKLYWSFDRKSVNSYKDTPLNVLPRFGLKWTLVMARAEFWITNSRLPLWLPKRNGTTYVQTWHGTPLKRLATDMNEVHMPGTNAENYKKNFISEAAKWDYLVSPNAYSTEIFKRAFQFKKMMIESGYPRNDLLMNENNEETIIQLKDTAKLPSDKKVILYAPTWRDNQFYATGKYKFKLQMDLDKMRERFGKDYVIVLRLHYLVAENLDLSKYKGFVYDFSSYPDINELYLMSDMMITDYSSVFFDYANLKRPMFFFAYDIEEYRDHLRGFYFDFETEAPGPLVKTTDELIFELEKVDRNGFQASENFASFYNTFCYLEDGNASKRVVERILASRSIK